MLKTSITNDRSNSTKNDRRKARLKNRTTEARGDLKRSVLINEVTQDTRVKGTQSYKGSLFLDQQMNFREDNATQELCFEHHPISGNGTSRSCFTYDLRMFN